MQLFTHIHGSDMGHDVRILRPTNHLAYHTLFLNPWLFVNTTADVKQKGKGYTLPVELSVADMGKGVQCSKQYIKYNQCNL
jgi:hypothetical protein